MKVRLSFDSDSIPRNKISPRIRFLEATCSFRCMVNFGLLLAVGDEACAGFNPDFGMTPSPFEALKPPFITCGHRR